MRTAHAAVVQGMSTAWNAGDSVTFARFFAEDGDVVDIRGMRLRGRASIASLYDTLFRSVFREPRYG